MKASSVKVEPRYCRFSGRFINHLHFNAQFLNKDYRYMYKVQQDYKANLKKYKDNTDLPRCKICGFVCENLSGHIVQGHKINLELYKFWFGENEKLVSDSFHDKLSALNSGKNNPGFNHGGRLSPFSKKFCKKDHDIKQTYKKVVNTRQKNNNETTRLSYYTSRGFSEDEAKIKLKERQSTFSKVKCIEKHGEEKGLKVWADRQEKWQKNYKHSNFSKISQKLFWKIYEETKNDYVEIFFAELDKNKIEDISGKNHEYRLRLNNLVICADFFIKDVGKIIEFDGTYWHRRNPENRRREDRRDKEILDAGYQILHITETEFKENEIETINKCKNFLKQ